MSGKSLRELGGNNRQHNIKHADPEMARRMQQVVDSEPETVAMIVLDTKHQLHDAFAELLNQDILTRKQYGILGDTLVTRDAPAEKNNKALRNLIFRTTVGTQVKLHGVLGWNKLPDDDNEGLDTIA